MANKEIREKKTPIDILGPVAYAVIYLIVSIQLGRIARDIGSTYIQGIFVQLLLLFSTFVVVAFPKYGYYTAVATNLLSIGTCIMNYFHGAKSAMTGLISNVSTIILVSIIFFFYRKVLKNNEELTAANQVLKEKDEKLTFLAYYDILTGLPNRQLFIERIDDAIAASRPFTVIAANIDNFKNINNQLGNNAGDAVLCSYSKKLKKYCGNSIFLARINGDEFGFILYGTETEAHILEYIDTIKEVISEPIKFNDVKINITMSYGISLYPANATDSTEMLKCVSSALSVAKSSGKNTHFFFNNMYRNLI